MSPESVVELLLVAIETGVGPGQAVHLPGKTVLNGESEGAILTSQTVFPTFM